MAVKIILLVCVCPFVFIMYFILKNEAKPKNGISFGATLTREQMQLPGIQQIEADYCKQMRRVFIIYMLAAFPMLFIPWFSVYITAWCFWLIAGIFALMLPFVNANKKIKAFKRENGWKQGEGQTMTEIKSAGRVRRVRWYQFAAPCILSLAVFIWAIVRYRGDRLETLGSAVGILAFTTFLFYGIAVWMDRQKNWVISTDSDVNLNYTRAQKNMWKKCWVVCAWINTAYTAGMVPMMDTDRQIFGLFIGMTAVYLAATAAVMFWVVQKKRKLDVLYRDKMDLETNDDDDNWLWGMFYYNPKDKHAMVEKRMGIGTTMNMASPAGKAMGVAAGLVLLALPFICIWVILLEFTPIRIFVADGILTADQICIDYSIPVSNVDSITLVYELPKWSKVSGTGMDSLLKGTFRAEGEGRCQVFLNPQNSVFIRLEAAGIIYYMSGHDDEETREVYEELAQSICPLDISRLFQYNIQKGDFPMRIQACPGPGVLTRSHFA